MPLSVTVPPQLVSQVSGDVNAADWRVSVEDARPDSLALCNSLQSERVPIVKVPLVE